MGEGDTMSKITFKATRNTVTANTYVAHALYVQNEAIINEMGGEIIRGAGTFKAEFPNAKLAKQFVEEKAITSISKREYNATRKTEPKKVEAPKPVSGKGKKSADNEVITVGGKPYTLEETDKGFILVPVAKGKGKKTATVTKGKGKGTTAPTPKKKPATKSAPAPKKGKGKAFDFGKYKAKVVNTTHKYPR
jgi:hypothetical protein